MRETKKQKLKLTLHPFLHKYCVLKNTENTAAVTQILRNIKSHSQISSDQENTRNIILQSLELSLSNIFR